MKKFTLIAAFFGMIFLASCTQKSCPTYAQQSVEQADVEVAD